MITITSFISPYRRDRDLVRKLHDDVKLAFFEVYVDCPIDEAEKRDPKGLYKRARAGELKGVTGVDDPYEAPEQPELVLRSDRLSVAESVAEQLGTLERRRLI
jgi:adenylylsulfate kinase